MATYIPLKQHQADDRGGNVYFFHYLDFDNSLEMVITTPPGLVDAAVLYGAPDTSKPTVTVSQSALTVTLTQGTGTTGELCIVTRHVGTSAAL